MWVSVCFCAFVDEAACLDAHAVCSSGWHGTEGILQCQEGGLADGEHYIIATQRVIEDAVDHGVCIQAECWVCLSLTLHIVKFTKLICSIWAVQKKCFLFVFGDSLSLSPPWSLHGSPSSSPHTFTHAWPFSCHAHDPDKTLTLLASTFSFLPAALQQLCFSWVITCHLSVSSRFLLQINCVTFPLPGEGPEQQLLKPDEWSYCDYFWVSSSKTQRRSRVLTRSWALFLHLLWQHQQP